MTARQKEALIRSVHRSARKAFRDGVPNLDALMAETVARRANGKRPLIVRDVLRSVDRVFAKLDRDVDAIMAGRRLAPKPKAPRHTRARGR